MRENRSRFAVLGALTIAPMSGYDIRRFFEAGISFFWQESYGQIYPILKQLKAEGLVTEAPSQTDGPEVKASDTKGGRRRTAYAITPHGRTALEQWLAAPTDQPTARNEILLKIFFARHGGPETVTQILTEYRERLQDRLTVYDAVEARLRDEYRGERDFPYWIATLRFGQQITRAMVAWCDEAQSLIAGARSAAPDTLASQAGK